MAKAKNYEIEISANGVTSKTTTDDVHAMASSVDPSFNDVQLEEGKHYLDGAEPKTKEDYIELIRRCHAEILRKKSYLKNAKDDYNDAVKELDAHAEYEEARRIAREKRDLLNAAKQEDEDVDNADFEVTKAIEDLGREKQIMSDILVVYGAKFNSRTVSLQTGKQNLIEFAAKLGREEPEQLSLF